MFGVPFDKSHCTRHMQNMSGEKTQRKTRNSNPTKLLYKVVGLVKNKICLFDSGNNGENS